MTNEKPRFNPVAASEEEVLQFWNNNNIFQQSIDREAPQGEYVFYDGPPFATGTPHYGHLVGNVLKDLIPRYFTMKGYRVERKWGWDCHGLPIENIVEKELGTKTKKDIETLGVSKFNNLCRSKVLTYADDWYKVINKLGRWADTTNPYKTMDLNYMESIWWVFKQLWDKEFIYKDYRSMHVCPRCETTLSQSEVTEGYKDIKDLSCIAKFELVDELNTFVLAWTTTPWTLVGNVALAVGEDIEYLKVNFEDSIYIVAKELVEIVFKDKEYTVAGSIVGYDLISQAYKPLFDYYSSDTSLENHDNGWKIYGADFVTTTDGTGVVHIAPAFGEDDMRLGKEKNLPFVQHVSMDGTFKDEVLDFSGLQVKPIDDHTTTDIEIIKYLAGAGLLFYKEKYEHSYPHCWRCDTPLINYATSSWFVAVTKIKTKLLETAKNINWSPDHIKKGRFGNWLEGARDWSISRQRFWASAIPIWECECGNRHVVASVKELEDLTGTKIDDIHKDKVDVLEFACPKCFKPMKRIPDVLDCWFESGSMPYAQIHYPFENEDKLKMPADFIAEGVDQTRAWFYYMHAISGGVSESHAFNNVIVNGIVLAEDGKKMAKKLKNYPDPMDVLNSYGADALRAYLMSSPVVQAENLNFTEKGVEEALRKNVMLLLNVFKFYETYSSDKKANFSEESSNILDKWILTKLNILIKEVTSALDSYNLPKAMRPITEFIDELSTWYLRRSRDRFKGDDELDKQFALQTTAYVLEKFSLVIAPIMPFVAEYLWQNLSDNKFSNSDKSVHLENWPSFSDDVDNDLISNMSLAKEVVAVGLMVRDEAGIKIRQVLAKAEVLASLDLDSEYRNIIADELNVKEVTWQVKEGNISVVLDTEITPELKKEGLKRQLVRLINLRRKDAGLTIEDEGEVSYSCVSTEIKQVFVDFATDIMKDTLCTSIVEGEGTPAKIDGQEISLSVIKKIINL